MQLILNEETMEAGATYASKASNFKPKGFVSKNTLHAKNQKAHLKYLKKKKDKINNATDQHELPKYNQIGEISQLMESMASSLKTDYKPKGQKYITDLKDIPLSKSTIVSYKRDCSVLSYIKYEDNIDGCILLDRNTTVVGILSVEEKNNGQRWIQTMEITKPYQGYGLSKQLLNLAVMHYRARFLSVNKKNQIAIKVCEDYGFKQYATIEPDTILMKIDDIGESLDECTLLEAVSRNARPIFIVNSWTNTPAGKLIRIGTMSTYTHSGIALDTSLERIYTFNADNKVNKFGGVSVESLQDYINYYDKCRINVECIFIKESDYIIIKKVMDHMVSVQDETTYDFLNLFNIIFGRAKEMGDNAMTMVCSQFVVYVLSKAGVSLTDKSMNLTTPKDLVTTIKKNPKVYLLYDGLGKDYDKKKIDRIFRKLKQKAEYIKECSL